jgi:sigma54-dependent transcription regulator
MVTTGGVTRTRGASGSAGPRVPQRARLTWQHTCTSCFARWRGNFLEHFVQVSAFFAPRARASGRR